MLLLYMPDPLLNDLIIGQIVLEFKGAFSSEGVRTDDVRMGDTGYGSDVLQLS